MHPEPNPELIVGDPRPCTNCGCTPLAENSSCTCPLCRGAFCCQCFTPDYTDPFGQHLHCPHCKALLRFPDRLFEPDYTDPRVVEEFVRDLHLDPLPRRRLSPRPRGGDEL